MIQTIAGVVGSIVLAVGGSLLGGCTQTVSLDPACSVLRQISFSAQRGKDSPDYRPESAINEFDTPETVDEIRRQNAAVKSLCP